MQTEKATRTLGYCGRSWCLKLFSCTLSHDSRLSNLIIDRTKKSVFVVFSWSKRNIHNDWNTWTTDDPDVLNTSISYSRTLNGRAAKIRGNDWDWHTSTIKFHNDLRCDSLQERHMNIYIYIYIYKTKVFSRVIHTLHLRSSSQTEGKIWRRDHSVSSICVDQLPFMTSES